MNIVCGCASYLKRTLHSTFGVLLFICTRQVRGAGGYVKRFDTTSVVGGGGGCGGRLWRRRRGNNYWWLGSRLQGRPRKIERIRILLVIIISVRARIIEGGMVSLTTFVISRFVCACYRRLLLLLGDMMLAALAVVMMMVVMMTMLLASPARWCRCHGCRRGATG